MESWRAFLRERFPGYLLPDAAHHALDKEAARRFLEQLTGRPNALEVLRRVSFFASRTDDLTGLVTIDIPALVRVLPSLTETQLRLWEGGFQGRLSIAETQALHHAGKRTNFVTRSRVRSFDLPENLLVRALAKRLLAELVFLRTARALPDGAWGHGLRDAEGHVRHLLELTPLREVSDGLVSTREEQAARSGRSTAYHACAAWWRSMVEALDDDDPAQIARVISDGALLPVSDSTQFELAVLIRLAEGVHARLESAEPAAWKLERTLVVSNRDEAFAFSRDGGRRIRMYYNQASLPEGPVDAGARHYLLSAGRMRPDVTMVFERDGAQYDALVIECKLSEDPSYVRSGFHEAVIYAHEYAGWLTGQPKAILVASSGIDGPYRDDDDVVAVSWQQWPPEGLLANIVQRAMQ